MHSFEDLNQIKKNTEDRSEKKSINYSELFDEALGYLEDFNKDLTHNKSYLIKASEKFIECANNTNYGERPYVFLAYISFILDDPILTDRYLAIALDINRESELVETFKAKLTHAFSN